MKKLIALIVGLLPSVAFAGPASGPDLWEQCALGLKNGCAYVSLKGWNPGVTTTFEPIWSVSAAYTVLAAAMSEPYCASSSNSDTAAGTGARTIRVSGVTTAFAEFSETITLEGQSSTNTALVTPSVLFLNSITVLTTGSGNMNLGVIRCGTGTNTSGAPAVIHIELTASSETAVQAAAAGGGNATEAFMYAVPADKTLLCRNVQAGSPFVTAAAGYAVVIDGYTNSTAPFIRYFTQMVHNTGANPSNAPGLIRFPEKTIVIGRAAGVTGTATGPLSLSAECLLVDNEQATYF